MMVITMSLAENYVHSASALKVLRISPNTNPFDSRKITLAAQTQTYTFSPSNSSLKAVASHRACVNISEVA